MHVLTRQAKLSTVGIFPELLFLDLPLPMELKRQIIILKEDHVTRVIIITRHAAIPVESTS